MTTPRPAPAFAMRRRQRVTGETFMVAIIDAQLVLEPGSELHLVRIRAGTDGDAPTHALRVVPPAVAVTRRQAGSRHGSRPRAGAPAREARKRSLAAARSIAHFEKGLRRDVGHLLFRVDRQRIAELLEQVAVELREDRAALLRAAGSGSSP